MTDFSKEKYDFALGIDGCDVWVKLMFSNEEKAREFYEDISRKMSEGESFGIQVGMAVTNVRTEFKNLPRSGH